MSLIPAARFQTLALVLPTALLFCLVPEASYADTWLAITDNGTLRATESAKPAAPTTTVLKQTDTGFLVRAELKGIQLQPISNEAGDFVRVTLPECRLAGEVGGPAYPVIRRPFATPVGADVTFTIREEAASTLSIADAGCNGMFYPQQPPARQPEGLDAEAITNYVPPFVFEKTAYFERTSMPRERISIRKLGIVRNRQLWQLEIRPVSVDAKSLTISVCPLVDVELKFTGGAKAPSWLHPTAGANRVVLNPEVVQPRGSSLGNYLIVTAEAFDGSDPLNQFAAAKTAQGYNVLIYVATPGDTRNDVYAYIQTLWNTPNAPDYVLLVGDPLGTTGLVGPTSIPICAGRTDLYYGCVDGPGDWYPDIAVGRFTVRDISELQVVVDKTLLMEDGPLPDPTYSQRAMFIGGNDPGSQAEDHHNYVIDNYMTPNGVESIRIYTDTLGSTTEDMSDALNGGVFFANYFAHAVTVQRWGTPHFDFDDIEALTNDGVLPYLMAFTCNGALYHVVDNPDQTPCMLEKFLLEPNKGIVCGYGSTYSQTPYTWEHWWDLYRFIMAAVYRHDIREVGPASHAGLMEFIAYYGPEDSVSQAMAERWITLGDPSFRLPEPPPENYLIVVAPDFVDSDSLDRFVKAKRKRGFNVITYKPHTGDSNEVIKGYIQSFWGTSDAPDYVLLVGDADYNTFTVTNDTIPYWEGQGSKGSPTDWPYVCLDGASDWYPEVPIGRFSVRTEAQLEAIVDKTLFVEAGNFADPDFARKGTFLANPSTYGQAEPTHDWVIDNYFTPNDYLATKLYAAQSADTQDVADAVNAGSLFTLYFGHSSSTGWWDPSFEINDVNALTNEGLYGIAFGWSCNTAYYLEDECYGETWIRAKDKGAAVYISASDYIYWGSVEEWAPSVALEKAFFASFFEDNIWRVGPAWMAGLYRFLEEYGGWDGDPSHLPPQNLDKCHNFFDEFVILGDPSLKLPRPEDFRLHVSPEGRAICTLSATEAAYALDILKIGDFAGAVHLEASGVPAGAVISLDSNDEYPPFTSNLVVTGLDTVVPGSYEIEIQATGGGKSHTITAHLHISDGAPAVPTLSTPNDGAVGIAREPTLSWMETASAAKYELQVSTNATFTNIVFSTGASSTSHTLDTQLDSNTAYFWRVRATNGCGASEYSTPYNFTTIDQTDYRTEQFSGSGDMLDLAYSSITLTPDGSGSFYGICGDTISEFYTEPTGTAVSIVEDGYALIMLSGGKTVQLYGTSYDRVYVNDNGNITFLSADGTWEESLSVHFSEPRVSPLFNDFTAGSGTVRWVQTDDLLAISFLDVPQYNSSDKNSFQVELFFDGTIRLSWLRVDCSAGVIGLSAGHGLPVDFNESDLSANQSCFPTGACCTDGACSILGESDCTAGGGTYFGDGVGCSPNPCVTYDPTCLIISEVVMGAESGDCPRWLEITNTGDEDFAFFEGGIIVQVDDSDDLNVDVHLAGLIVPARRSITVNSNSGGTCTGAYDGVYGISPDIYTEATFGIGNERLILTDTNDGSHILDIYGVYGKNSEGTPWEYTRGYAYRLEPWTTGFGVKSDEAEWFLGGLDSLNSEFPTQLLLNLTTPGMHAFSSAGCSVTMASPDLNCDEVVDIDDVACLVQGLLNTQSGWRSHLESTYPGEDRCAGQRWNDKADLSGDGVANARDIDVFIDMLLYGE